MNLTYMADLKNHKRIQNNNQKLCNNDNSPPKNNFQRQTNKTPNINILKRNKVCFNCGKIKHSIQHNSNNENNVLRTLDCLNCGLWKCPLCSSRNKLNFKECSQCGVKKERILESEKKLPTARVQNYQNSWVDASDVKTTSPRLRRRYSICNNKKGRGVGCKQAF
eukprot:UN22334